MNLTLYLVHYSSVEEGEKKWNERKQRINWDNIAIIDTDREGMTEELKDRFLSIDKTAECNQMKVLRAMQKNHLSEACFAPTIRLWLQ